VVTSGAIEVGTPYQELTKPISLAAKARLALEIVTEYVRVRRLLRRHDLPRVVAALRRHESATSDARLHATGLRLGRAIGRTLGHLPFDSRCLVQSLVLTSMLDRRGIESVLVIGVSVEPEFSAHAWVESDGRALLAPLEDANRLVEL
jgi:hypothetical protein